MEAEVGGIGGMTGKIPYRVHWNAFSLWMSMSQLYGMSCDHVFGSEKRPFDSLINSSHAENRFD